MIIDFNDINYYFLTCNNQKRKSHMLELFKNYKLTEVNPVSTEIGISKEQSGSTGFSKMLDLAVKNQNRNTPFQPFVLLEDDVNICKKFPDNLNIPDDTDILYIGISSSGMQSSDISGSGRCIRYTSVNGYSEIVKVYNMLSTHGFIVCSLTGLITLQKCLFEDFYRNRGYDMSLAHIQPHINAYALRTPLVYQWKPLGGWEIETNIRLTNDSTETIPEKWINKRNLTFLTIHNNS